MKSLLSVLLSEIKKSWYWILISSILIFSIIVFSSNGKLLRYVLSQQEDLSQQVRVLLSFYGLFFTNFSLTGEITVILLSILMSVNIVLLARYIRILITIRKKGSGASLLKASLSNVIAVIGLGCASCGAALITTILSLVGAVGVIKFLPLHGEEFGLIGMVIVIISIRILLKKIQSPYVC